MTKLLSANLARLWKSAIFWLGTAFMAGMCVTILVNQYYVGLREGYDTALDSFAFGYSLLIGMVAAVFCSLFLGTEYSDGTIRNKLVVGHTRASIYLSVLLTCITAAVLMCVAFLIVAFAVGIPLFGGIQSSPWLFSIVLLDSLVMVCAVCSILAMICMLVPNKAVSAIICLLLMAGLLVFALHIVERLAEPEFFSMAYAYIDGEFAPVDMQPNPLFLSESMRKLYEYAFDILPTGQAYQFTNMKLTHLWQMPLYSLAIVAASTFTGMYFFQKKDIQ